MKRILRDLFLGKIAAVDRPCQAPALMTIMKRAQDADIDDSAYIALAKRKWSAEERKEAEKKGWAMPGGRYPIENTTDLEDAIHAVGRGKGSHAAIRAHIISRAKALGASDKIPDDWKVAKIAKAMQSDLAKAGLLGDAGECGAETFDEVVESAALSQKLWDVFYRSTDALRESICSILKDDEVTDKDAMIGESLKEFSEFLQENIPGEIGKSLAVGFTSAIAGAAGTPLKGATMSKELKKALGLPETATEADIIKAIADQAAALAKAERVAKMSAKHKAHHEKLKGEAADKFEAMSPAERDKEMEKDAETDEKVEKALKSGEAFKTPEGVVMHKRDFGTDAAFSFAKSANDRLTAQAVEIAKHKETEDAAAFAKRAVAAGQPEAFGAILRKAYAGDATAQAEVERTMAALKKQAEEGGLFRTFGSGSAAPGSALEKLNTAASELRKRDTGLTQAQAFSKVYEDPANKDLVKQYKQEQGLPA